MKKSKSEVSVKYSSIDCIPSRMDLNGSHKSLIKLETAKRYIDHSTEFPLQNAVNEGNIKELKRFLAEGEDVFKFSKGRSALHFAAIHSNHKIGKECARIIIDHVRTTQDDKSYTSFINKTDDLLGETALHLAAKNAAESSVELLIFSGADVQIKSAEGKQQLEIIFAKVPKAMEKVLNYGISWCDDDDNDDGIKDDENDRKVTFDFGSLIGYPTPEDTILVDPEIDTRIWKKFPFETEILAKSLGSTNSYETILTHPLVKMFIILKWKKIRELFWASQIIHALWLFLYTAYIVEVFIWFCPYEPSNQTVSEYTKSQNGEDETLLSTDKITTGFANFGNPNNDTDFVPCDLKGRKFLSILTCINLTLTILVLLKEIYEMRRAQTVLIYFQGLENIGQMALIFTQFVTSWPWMVQQTLLYPWVYQVAALGIFLSWILILCEVSKFPQLGVYCSMLLKVIKSYALFFVTFISLLIAFALSFSILFPGKGGFVSIPVSFLKVIVMMAGEIEYMGVFHGDDGPVPFPTSGHIIYAIFTIMVTIILFNLLVGLTVNDIQGLQNGAEVLSLSSQLDNIQLLESFILSKNIQNFLKYCGKIHWLKKYLIIDPTKPSIIDDCMKLIIPMKEIPRELHIAIRLIASENSENSVTKPTEPNPTERKTHSDIFGDDEILMRKCRIIFNQMIEIWERNGPKEVNEEENKE